MSNVNDLFNGRARVGGNQHQGGLNVLQILFNKEPRAGAKVAYRKASVTSRSEVGVAVTSFCSIV